eukprot:781880-Prymnesium_polylepis.1
MSRGGAGSSGSSLPGSASLAGGSLSASPVPTGGLGLGRGASGASGASGDAAVGITLGFNCVGIPAAAAGGV